jgi:hypothetical protein
MQKYEFNNLSGDLNYLVANYLTKEDNIPAKDKENILEIVKFKFKKIRLKNI